MYRYAWMVALLVLSTAMGLRGESTVMPELFKQWTVFAHVDLSKVDLTNIHSIPASLQGVDQKPSLPRTLAVSDGNLADVSTVSGAFKTHDAALLMSVVHVDKPTSLKVGASADWWMSWLVNGKEIYSLRDKGNKFPPRSIKDHVFLLPLEAGDNLICVELQAGSKGWKLFAGSDDSIAPIKAQVVKNLEDYRDKPFDYILDEETVPSYTLPELLKADDGMTISSKAQWEAGRKQTLLDAFGHYIYGRIPAAPDKIAFETVKDEANALDGSARFRIIRITLTRNEKSFAFHLNLYTPQDGKPAPVFLLTNNRHRTNDPFDPDSAFWPARKLIAQGFAAAEINNKELAADQAETFRNGVMQLYPELEAQPDGWGAISVWAYGVMRSVDFLAQDSGIDVSRIMVIGHSRGGKIALWAAANDPRIAMVCVNDSGCSGSAIARRKVGETIKAINDQFPHWFNGIYKQYNDRENDLPVDQHMLVALVAPRAVCVGSAIDDYWADPHGEYLSLIHATPVFELYGLKGLKETQPVILDGHTIGDGLSYHIRSDGHGLTEKDWRCYMEAARTFLKISK